MLQNPCILDLEKTKDSNPKQSKSDIYNHRWPKEFWIFGSTEAKEEKAHEFICQNNPHPPVHSLHIGLTDLVHSSKDLTNFHKCSSTISQIWWVKPHIIRITRFIKRKDKHLLCTLRSYEVFSRCGNWKNFLVKIFEIILFTKNILFFLSEIAEINSLEGIFSIIFHIILQKIIPD